MDNKANISENHHFETRATNAKNAQIDRKADRRTEKKPDKAISTRLLMI